MTDYSKLREAAEKATPGPWKIQEWRHWAEPSERNFAIQYTATDKHNKGTEVALASVKLYGSSKGSNAANAANAAFIALANPTTILTLSNRFAT